MFEVQKKNRMKSLRINWFQREKNQIQIDDICLIGSDSMCGIPITGPGISGRHARIEKKETHFLIRDLRSETGIKLNSVPVFEAPIYPGDTIEIGGVQLNIMGTSQEFSLNLSSKNLLWDKHLQRLPSIAKSEHPVLILGPSGTGKELVSKALHQHSYRRRGPFVSVNCSALTETLVESELFGHVKGSFTGAIQDRKGAFEAARGGTLFLDEVGDLPAPMQAKLLRAIENKEIRPVGSDRTVKTDVRILAATHQRLSQMVEEKRFRSDLYFRLNVLRIHSPSLRERMEDFESLLYFFAKEHRISFSFAAIQKLKQHSWPGNIRELKNAVARASALFSGHQVQEDQVDELIEKMDGQPESLIGVPSGPTPSVLKEIERQMIIRRLSANKGNQRQTATDLGMPKSTLHDRLKYYNIDPKSFRCGSSA